MISNAIASNCQMKDVSVLNNQVKEYLIDGYFKKCKTQIKDNELSISILLDETTKQSIRENLERVYGSIQNITVDNMDKMGLNSEVYNKIEFGKDLYGIDNPLFSIQKGLITYLVATNPNFKGLADVHISYLDENGATIFDQTINGRLKDIAVQLSNMHMTEKEIAMLIAEKIGLDAGVLMNKNMTPYQIDLICTMENIEISDSSYIYYCSIPRYTTKILSMNDYNVIKNNLENELGHYVQSMNFFDKKGADKFDLKIIYVYIDSQNEEELIKYIFNPYTLNCDMIPISKEIVDIFSTK